MSIESQVQAITKTVEDILRPDPEYFLVEVRIAPNNHIKVFLDGDSGISIEKCVATNRALYKEIEESEMFPGDDFSLEVSSPGLDEPLKLDRQYRKNVGRKIEVLMKDGIKIEGKLSAVNEHTILVEETRGKNKKLEIVPHEILLDSIKTTKIQIVF